ncbi:MAG TPA: rod shape-determining protein MreC [Burkholderiales bacterium]|nr:rod shape-determining protein MreC [Burkholderiales bacterium]
MEHTPPQFFHRGPAPIARLTFFALLSVFLMVLDARFRYAEPLRQVLAIVAYPLQQLATAPFVALSRASEFFSTQSQLRDQNAALRAQKLRDAEDLLTLEALRAENESLRRLLRAREQVPGDSIFAEIVYAGRDPFSRKVIIDRGVQHGVQTGQPVIDASGVLGQVTRVQPLLAEVTLIVDKDHAIPVQVVRNGLRGVAYGSGDGSTLELRHMASNAEVEAGDLLVTSGLDGLYPRGLPVAKVAKIERDAAYAFAKIVCQPVGGTTQHQQVLVLQTAAGIPAWSAEPERGKKGARAKRSVRRGE